MFTTFFHYVNAAHVRMIKEFNAYHAKMNKQASTILILVDSIIKLYMYSS